MIQCRGARSAAAANVGDRQNPRIFERGHVQLRGLVVRTRIHDHLDRASWEFIASEEREGLKQLEAFVP